MKAKIIFLPNGGLANRMRSLDSACALAAALGCRLSVVWDEAGMQCPMRNLFEPPANVGRIWDVHRKTPLRLFIRDALRLTRRITNVRRIDMPDAIAIGGDLEEWRRQVSRGPVFIYSNDRIFPTPNPYSGFSFSPPILERVRSISSAFTERTIGVHIRRTDNIWAIKNSPTDAFTRELDAEIERNPSVSFFLATDSPEDEAALVKRFGARIRVSPKRTLERSAAAGNEDALVDLLCLSRTQRILGCFSSSFSQEAAVLGRIPLDLVFTDRVERVTGPHFSSDD